MITTDDIKYLEKLIKIELTDQKREQYRNEIDEILEYVKEVSSIDLPGAQTTEYSHNNIFKDDEIRISENHTEKALENAPEKLGDLYKVSQVIKQ